MGLDPVSKTRFVASAQEDHRMGRIVTLIPRDPTVRKRRDVILMETGHDHRTGAPLVKSMDGRVWNLASDGWMIR